MATLDDVLNGKDEPETQTTAQPAPEPVVADAPVVSGDDAAPPAANVDEKLVPLSAVEAERKGRKDWKEKALRTEGENALLKRQLEEFQRAPRPTASAQPPQGQGLPVPELPDPYLDPEGYRAAVVETARIERLNDRWLDQEESAKEKFGEEAVEAAFAALSEAAKSDPSLAVKVRGARNPWVEIVNWHKKQQAQAEIGDDPTAFREKLEKEIREKIAAESGQPPAPNQSAAPAPRIPQSLASTPSVAGRSSVPFTGPDKLGDIFDRKH
jgi:phytoene dehydrogenase-like protein